MTSLLFYCKGFENGEVSLFDVRQASEAILSTNCSHKRWISKLVYYKNKYDKFSCIQVFLYPLNI